MLQFGQRLAAAVQSKGNAVCVGLDPRTDQLPFEPVAGDGIDGIASAYECFCRSIIDVVADLVPVVKPQAAFFEALGPAGCAALARVNRHAQDSGLLVIHDAKRGDIGSTALAYAEAYLGGPASPWHCDALTVNPFLGDDTLEPFVDACGSSGTGIFVLARTSNPGSGFIQQADSGGSVSLKVARWIERINQRWADEPQAGHYFRGPVGGVVGATYPDELLALREAMPSAWLLIPGYGAQGGKAADLAAARQADGGGMIVNSSRGIIFAFRDRPTPGDWTTAVRDATLRMIDDLAS